MVIEYFRRVLPRRCTDSVLFTLSLAILKYACREQSRARPKKESSCRSEGRRRRAGSVLALDGSLRPIRL
jgi:hypothetical protein